MDDGQFTVRDACRGDDQNADHLLPAFDLAVYTAHFETELGQQDQSHETHQHERCVFEHGEPLDQADANSRHEPQRQDADEDTGADNPQTFVQGHGCHDVINRQREIHDLDLDDREQEPLNQLLAGHTVDLFFGLLGQMLRREVEQIGRADELQPVILADVRCQSETDAPEKVRADDPIPQGFLLLMFRQSRSHGRDGHSVIDREQALDDNQRKDDRQGRNQLSLTRNMGQNGIDQIQAFLFLPLFCNGF